MTIGQEVMITGASGGVGSVAIGVARRLGGVVDAVSTSANVDFVRGLGVRTVFDRGDRAWLARVERQYSVVLDAAAAFGLIGMRKILVPGGAYVSTLPSVAFVGAFLLAPFLRRRCKLVMVRPRRSDLEWLAQALRKGLSVPIARVFPIREAAGAIEDFTTGGARGKIAIRVDGGF
jgi:NADPH:quinone reductase-like Zn-dependent oxidoreductase